MKKPVLGLLLGGVLGAFDGLSALVTAPETATQIGSIVGGSTFKGVLAGALIGGTSGRVKTLGAGMRWGGAIGLFFAALIVVLQKVSGEPAYYWQIMLPGSVLGVIVGYATNRHAPADAP